MRELRLYVIDGDEPAGRWRIVDRTALQVADGEAWVTVEGRPDDHWLGAGDSLAFEPGVRVWISAGPRGAGRACCARVVAAARRVARRPAPRGRVAADVACGAFARIWRKPADVVRDLACRAA